MERIMNEENVWEHNVEGDAVIGPADNICREEVVQVLSEMNTQKPPGPSYI